MVQVAVPPESAVVLLHVSDPLAPYVIVQLTDPPSGMGVTEAVKVTGSPATRAEGDAETPVIVEAMVTVWSIVPFDAWKVMFPSYVAVIVYSEPAAVSGGVLQLASPFTSATFEHIVTDGDPFGLSVKVTYPEGVSPLLPATVAVKLTDWPERELEFDELTLVVLGTTDGPRLVVPLPPQARDWATMDVE